MSLEHGTVLITIPEPYCRNQWVRREVDREFALADGQPHELWLPELLEGYRGHEEPLCHCLCGGAIWFDNRTGGHKCPECGTYTNAQGQVLGRKPIKES